MFLDKRKLVEKNRKNGDFSKLYEILKLVYKCLLSIFLSCLTLLEVYKKYFEFSFLDVNILEKISLFSIWMNYSTSTREYQFRVSSTLRVCSIYKNRARASSSIEKNNSIESSNRVLEYSNTP